MGFFDAPSRSMTRDYGDIYRAKADRLTEETRLLFARGRYRDAEERVRELIDLQTKVVGDRHPEYASGLCLLAEVLTAQDELHDAETLLQYAVEIRKKALGEKHPEYAACLDQLARIMLRWEDLTGAEPLIRKAIEIRKTAVGEEHPDYADSLATLGELLLRGQDAEAAEPLLRQALEIRRSVQGEAHPDVAEVKARLAHVLEHLDNTAEAERLLREAVESYRAGVGEHHPDYAEALESLAALLTARGDLDGAEPLWQLLLDMRRQSLGPRHSSCASVLHQLGQIAQRRGDVVSAEKLLRQSVEIIRDAVGERHPDYASGVTHLALLLQRNGDLAAAEPLLRQALAIRKDVLGARHPDYATSLVNLAQLVQKRGDPTWARMLLREAAEVRRQVFGEQHPEYAVSLAALAEAYSQQGDLAKAEPLLRQALEVRRHAYGEDHPAFAAGLSSLAGVLRARGDLDAAEPLLRQGLEIRKATLGENHPDYLTNLGNLAWLLQKQGDRAGAEAFLSQSLEIRRRLVGEAHPDFLQNLERLESLRAQAPASPPPAATVAAEPVVESKTPAFTDEHEEELEDELEILYPFPPTVEPEPDFEKVASFAEDEPDLVPVASAQVEPETPVIVETGHEDDVDDPPAPSAYATDLIIEANEPPVWMPDDPAQPAEFGQPAVFALEPADFDEPSGLDAFLADHLPPDTPEVADTADWPAPAEATVAGPADSEGFYPSNGTFPTSVQDDESAPNRDASDAEATISPENLPEYPGFSDVEAVAVPTADFTLDTAAEPSHDREDAEAACASPILATPDEPFEPESAQTDAEVIAPLATESPTAVTSAVVENSAEGDWPGDTTEPSPVESEALATPADAELLLFPPVEPAGRVDQTGTDVEPEAAALLSTTDPVAVTPRAQDDEPARSLSMSQSSSHLSQELAALSDRFSELGERLLSAARQLHAPGVPPADDLLEALGGCRREFHALSDRIRDQAGALLIATPPAEQIHNLSDLNTLLDQVAETEIRQSKSEETRRRALSVLDRVLLLSHSSNADFAPLHDVHNRARELHSGISQTEWHSPHPETDRLAEGDHHFADLLTLIEERDDLSDDLWASLHENVGNAFGKSLAAAAARSKLVVRHDMAHAEHH